MKLSPVESRYFNQLRDHILNLFGLNIPILPLDHDRFLPTEPGSKILGCCQRCQNSAGEAIGYIITIDIPYIKACFHGRKAPYSPYSTQDLIETICHEIAHTKVWNHGPEHTDLTRQLEGAVLLFNKNKRPCKKGLLFILKVLGEHKMRLALLYSRITILYHILSRKSTRSFFCSKAFAIF